MTIILYFFKYLKDVYRCLAGHFRFADTINLRKFSQHFEHEGRFVTLAAMRHGCHIGGISLEDNAAERYCRRLHIISGKGLRQIGLLEGQHTTDAEYKTVKLEQFTRLNLVPRKTVEYTARQVITVTLENGHHLVLRLTTMDHQGQACLYRPAHLMLEGLELFLLEFSAPIKVKSHLADGYRLRKCRGDGVKHLTPIGTYFLRMETEHGITIARILSTKVDDRLARFEVNARHENLHDTGSTGTSHHLIAIGSELLTIKVTMGIYELDI